MSNFAKIEGGIVTQIIVADATFFETFIDTSPGVWIDSQGSSVGVGDLYSVENGFHKEPPYDSWVFINNKWVAPNKEPIHEYADDGTLLNPHSWNEETQAWVEVIPEE